MSKDNEQILEEYVASKNPETQAEIRGVDDTFNDDTPAQTAQRKHAHYFKDVSDFNEMDTYLFCRVWKVKDDSGALHHALKKLMDAGKRGNKDKIKDVTEARDTLNRYLEIEAMFAEVSE